MIEILFLYLLVGFIIGVLYCSIVVSSDSFLFDCVWFMAIVLFWLPLFILIYLITREGAD